MRCEAEMCPFWTGQGCICDATGLDADDRREQLRHVGILDDEDAES